MNQEDNKIIFRKAKEIDVFEIMKIINQAQDYLRANNIDQWQNDYPNTETILDDVRNDVSYVLLKDDHIIGTIALIFQIEPTYNNIYQGSWLSDKKYMTIHRIAIDNKYFGSGFASLMMEYAEELGKKNHVFSIRIDTQKDNLQMQKHLLKNQYILCGLIYLNDNSERLAFEKILD